jgi:hypothetical protein
VLENLEKVMPARVHLVSIQPTLDEDNQLALKMTVAGDSRDRAFELPRRMEGSGRFAATSIVSEHNLQSTTNGDTEQFDIAAIYIPEPVVPATERKTGVPAKPLVQPAATEAKPVTAAKPKQGAPVRRSH